MKKIILVLLAIFYFTSGTSQQKEMVIIKGLIRGNLKGHDKMYLYTRITNDSTLIKNGNYTFSFPFKGVGLKFFLPEYIMKQGLIYRPFGILIAGPGTYYITSDIEKGMYNSEVKGPEATRLYYDYGRESDKAHVKINKVLSKEYGDAWYQHSDEESLKKSQDSLQQSYLVPLIEKLVKEHPNSEASAYVLEGDGITILNIKQQEAMYNILSDKLKHSDVGQKFHDYTEGLKNSVIGKEVSNFSLVTPDGKPLSFDRFKGKYVMIDFWASWCVPCRQSFPEMRKMYQQYKDKGFEIYSISIDQSKSAWLKAVKEERNPWPQALDTKNIAAKGFAVNAVPTTYLINPEGKIIAKQTGMNPDGKEQGNVERELSELFGQLHATTKPETNDKKVMKAIPMSTIK